jgi:hypothetical protein
LVVEKKPVRAFPSGKICNDRDKRRYAGAFGIRKRLYTKRKSNDPEVYDTIIIKE